MSCSPISIKQQRLFPYEKKEQSSPGTGISENENVERLKTERGN